MDNESAKAMAPSTPKPHPSVEHIMQFFKSHHLPPDLSGTAAACEAVAVQMAENLPHNPELTVGLRKLLEAKDCFVRAKLAEKTDD